jgi:hypothetical protein
MINSPLNNRNTKNSCKKKGKFSQIHTESGKLGDVYHLA